MPFLNFRLPVEVERGARGGPRFSTSILELSSGHEQRNINWQFARYEWDISYGIQEKADLEDVIALFHTAQGQGNTFLFKDWTDYQIGRPDAPQVIGVGNGTQTLFQANRRYTTGAFSYVRPVQRLVSGTVQVYLGGVLQGSGFTVDLVAGTVSFSAAPGNGVSVGLVAEFDVLVRFGTDTLDVAAEWENALSVPAIMIKSVREPLP